MKAIRVPLLVILLLALTTLSYAPQEARVLRFPAVSADQIVFSSAGDLYTVPIAGGVARKLTSFYEGYEAFARFSPDGASIAFTGEYDGNREVYLIPSGGGVPKRLTYTPSLGRDDISDRMGPNNLVMGWTHDGERIVFRSRMAEWNDFNGQLYLASKNGGTPERIPLPRGGFCSFSPDDTKLAYNRIFREFRTWKRYRGGMADDIWIYDFAAKTVENVTANPALDIIPMWSGDRIYFLSDRDENKRLNLYVFDLASKATRQLTSFAEFDIKFPSLGPKHIVFENGGHLYTFDLASEKTERVPVVIADDAVSVRGGVVKVDRRITNYEIAPDGQRALFGARGDVFTVPAKHGNTRNLTATPGIHERSSKWSPDGRTIAFISDRSGTDEIWLTDQAGGGEPRQLTTGGDTYKYQIRWSPDGTKILWNDKMQRLAFVDVASKAVTVAATAEAGEIFQFAWSPDSRWIAYGKPEIEGLTRVHLYSLDSRKTVPVTDGWYNSERALVQPGRQVPLLRLRPGLPSRLQLDRMGPCLPGHVPGLFRDPGQRHAVALPPQERRGRGQARAGPRRQARRGRQEDRRQTGARGPGPRQGRSRRPHGPPGRPAHRDRQLRRHQRHRRRRLLSPVQGSGQRRLP